MKIRQSDINLVNGLGVNVYASRTAIYGMKSKTNAKATRMIATLIALLYHQAAQDLDLPKIDVRLAMMSRSNYNGECIPVRVDDFVDRSMYVGLAYPRRSLGTILSTYAHELVHVDQFHTGKLEMIRPRVYQWYGDEIEIPVDYSHEQYMNFPWEYEAFTRQFDLINRWIRELRCQNLITENRCDYLLSNVEMARGAFVSDYTIINGVIKSN